MRYSHDQARLELGLTENQGETGRKVCAIFVPGDGPGRDVAVGKAYGQDVPVAVVEMQTQGKPQRDGGLISLGGGSYLAEAANIFSIEIDL